MLPEHWYIPSQFYLVLDSIETITDIYNAISEGKIIKILEDEYVLVNYMNLFLGIKYMDDELKEMVENKFIKAGNEKYQEMLTIVRNAFPINFINGRYPLLCEYYGMIKKLELLIIII